MSEKTPVSLGTATPGGGFPIYGEAVAATINEVDPTLEVRPRNTKGSTENVPLLEAGALDLALVQGEVAHEALAGVGRAPADLCVLAAMYSTPGMFVVRADSPYQSIADLKGRPVAFGARGSGLIILARYVLDGLGFERDGDFQAVFLEAAGDGPAMVLDGTVAALWGGGLGWPGFAAVARGPAGARFLVPDLDGIHRIQTKHPFLKMMRVPAGSLPGAARGPDPVGSWSFIMARPSLPDEVAYRLARALHRGEAALGGPARAGARDHRGQHGGRGRAAGADAPRRAALPRGIGLGVRLSVGQLRDSRRAWIAAGQRNVVFRDLTSI